MERFFKNHGTTLKTTALILMIALPFVLYAAAMHGSLFQVKLILGAFVANMLFVMVKG